MLGYMGVELVGHVHMGMERLGIGPHLLFSFLTESVLS